MPNLYDYPLAVIDVETTGTSYTHGGIIDVGVLRIEQGNVVDTYQQLVNPGSAIPAFITQLTGITNEQLADAPAFADMSSELQNILSDCIFVAHNARFDYAFIKEEFRRQGIRFAPKTFCTVKLSRALYPQFRHHKLDALIERFNIQVKERHRAFGDAQATWQALDIMVQQAQPKLLEYNVKQQLRQPTLPPQLPKSTVDSLPESPGVYIFENSQGGTLYVGKSVNIRSRVLSHFSDDVRSAKELTLSQEVADISTIPTAGELSALLKESQLIKELMPVYNRLLRRKSELVLAVESRTTDSSPTVHLGRHSPDQIESARAVIAHTDDAIGRSHQSVAGHESQVSSRAPQDRILAVFKSQREAKESLISLAKEHNLCHKLLGLEKTKTACFYHHLGICRGACVGKEKPIAYTLRFEEAFAKLRLKRWPYPGPILVTEHGADQNDTSFIIDQWRIMSVIERHDQDTETIPFNSGFDLDQYKILRRFLSQPHPHATINLLHPSDVHVT